MRILFISEPYLMRCRKDQLAGQRSESVLTETDCGLNIFIINKIIKMKAILASLVLTAVLACNNYTDTTNPVSFLCNDQACDGPNVFSYNGSPC